MGRENFENALKQLHLKIIDMGCLVETAIEDAVRAFVNRDLTLCMAIIENDKKVNALEKKIESKCLWLIAKEQPIASDLRKISAALKTITDMERIGDHAVDIAELTQRMVECPSFADSVDIPQMAEAAIKMVRSAITAYVNYDLALAEKVEGKDDKVDEYFHRIKRELSLVFAGQPQEIDHAIDLLLIAKYLERIADHAVNISQWVHFSQTGEHKNAQIF